jgi:beta-glucosidase
MRLAAQATVVLRNDVRDGVPTLPLDTGGIATLALIGIPGTEPFVQGGGSGVVHPRHVVSPAEGLRGALPASTRMTVCRGVPINRLAPDLDLARRATDPQSGRPGVRVEVLDSVGTVLSSRRQLDEWTGWYNIADDMRAATQVRLTVEIRLSEPGVHHVAVGTVGEYTIAVDGAVVDVGHHLVGSEVILNSSINDPPDVPVRIEVTEPRSVTLTALVQVIEGEAYGRFARAALRHALPGPSEEEQINDAVLAARDADVAIVMVGTTIETESEGWDRSTLALPGRQDELVARVTAANPRTIVVVNAGAPAILPWLDEPSPDGPAAVLWWSLPGQEAGHALAAVLLGAREPAGRLPWTLPAREEDVPVLHARPVDGVLTYHEGADVGYRAWMRNMRQPARPFGFGLGWGEWRYNSLEVAGSIEADDLEVTVALANLSRRAASEVVQVYIAPSTGAGVPVVRRLAGSSRTEVGPGTSSRVTIRLPRRVFESWCPGGGWRLPAGDFLLQVGRDSADLRLSTTVTVTPTEPNG